MANGVIVVGVDGSATSILALQWAVAEAEATGRDVTAVTVWRYVPALEPGAIFASVDEVGATHSRQLDEVVRTVERPGVTVRTHVVEGDANEVLVEAAQGADLLVLGTHGRGRMLRALVGSVSAYCLRHARCPVAILPVNAVETKAKAGPEMATISYLPGPIV
jgi:nucleotide-binding universal stress UspA family protein